MNKQRIVAFDYIRCICIWGIVQEHFLWLCRNYNIEFNILEMVNSYGNLGWGGFGTAMFFILSGAALTYNYSGASFSIKNFYKKRFLKICIPLYIGHIIFFVIISICQDHILYKITFQSILNTLMGRGLVGEWFTTVIIFCYIIFPILRFLIINYVGVSSIIFSIIFIANLKLGIFNINDSKWSSYTNGVYAFWIGMLIAKYMLLERGNTIWKIDKKFFILLFLLGVMPWFSLKISLDGMWFYIPTIICSIILFILMLYIKKENKIIKKISSYSYEVYIIHHQIMYLTFPVFSSFMRTQSQYMLFFILIIVLISMFSKKFHKMNSWILRI